METCVIAHMHRRNVLVEIGNDHLKIAETQPGRGGRVNKLHLARMADIMPPMDEAIRRVFRDLRLPREGVTLLVPRYLVTVRTLRFPSTDPAEIDEMLKLEVGRQTPYAREEIVSSYRLTGVDAEGYTGVLLVIAKSSVIRERLDLLDSIGIEVDRVALGSEAVHLWGRTRCPPGDGSLRAIVDMDSKYSDLILARGETLVFSRHLPLGASHREDGEDRFEERLHHEVSHAIRLYRREERDARVTEMVFTGLAEDFAKAVDRLDVRLDIPGRILPSLPAESAALSRQARRAREDAQASLTPLLGAAWGGEALRIDLMPPERRIRNLMRRKQRSLCLLGALVLAMVLVAGAGLLATMQLRQDRIDALEAAASSDRLAVREVERKIAIARAARSRLDRSGSVLELLAEISRLTPEPIQITSLHITPERTIVLRGRGMAMSDVFRYVTGLESSPLLETVKATRTTTTEEGGREIARFELHAGYRTKGERAARDEGGTP